MDQTTIAGRRGFVLNLEQGEAGNRWLSSEWVIDERLPLPLRSTQYDQDGRLLQRTTLVEYQSR